MLGFAATIALVGGLLAGLIALGRLGRRSFVPYFILGAVFPILGIVMALLKRRPARDDIAA